MTTIVTSIVLPFIVAAYFILICTSHHPPSKPTLEFIQNNSTNQEAFEYYCGDKTYENWRRVIQKRWEMKGVSYTPGPWIQDGGRKKITIWAPSTQLGKEGSFNSICLIEGNLIGGFISAEQQANARLIAAAPE